MTARSLICGYVTLWAATAVGAGLAALGVRVFTAPAPRDALAPTLQIAVELLGHNALVALWPLGLILVGWPALAGARRLGDALVAAQLLAHGLLVGSALGQYPELWRYLPHLPLEWLALAIPTAAWLTARSSRPGHRAVTPGDVLLIATSALAALTGAAAIETYLVPVS